MTFWTEYLWLRGKVSQNHGYQIQGSDGDAACLGADWDSVKFSVTTAMPLPGGINGVSKFYRVRSLN